MTINFIQMKKDNIDYELLHKWSEEPFIQEWFEQRSLSLEEIKEKYDNKVNHSNQTLYYIEVDNKIIGFFQYYPYEKDDEMIEYDVLIGEENYLNKGIGTEVVKKINQHIFDHSDKNKIVVRPCKRNKRACHCYEKSGFELIKDYSGTDTIGNQEIFSIYVVERN